MSEIRRIGDRVTVLRDGRRVATLAVDQADDERLLQLMTGRVISQVFPTIAYLAGRPILEVSQLTTADHAIRNVSLTVRCGG